MLRGIWKLLNKSSAEHVAGKIGLPIDRPPSRQVVAWLRYQRVQCVMPLARTFALIRKKWLLEQDCFVVLLERGRSLDKRPALSLQASIPRCRGLITCLTLLTSTLLQDPQPRNADFAIKYTKLKAHGMRILIQSSDALQ